MVLDQNDMQKSVANLIGLDWLSNKVIIYRIITRYSYPYSITALSLKKPRKLYFDLHIPVIQVSSFTLPSVALETIICIEVNVFCHHHHQS